MKTIRGEFRSLVVIGIPTLGMVDIDFAMNLFATTLPVNCSPHFYVVRGKPVDEACNMIVQEALRVDAEYVFFREDDVLIPPGAMEHLLARDVDVCSGVAFSKQAPPFPIVLKTYGGGAYTDWYADIGQMVEVAGCGVACTLIKTEVFRKVEPPWFKTISIPETLEDGLEVARMTQDLYFMRKAILADFRIWVDTGVLCGHKDVETGTLYYFDPKVKLPCWLEKGAKEPKFIPPMVKTMRVIELTEDERQQNRHSIEEFEANAVEVPPEPKTESKRKSPDEISSFKPDAFGRVVIPIPDEDITNVMKTLPDEVFVKAIDDSTLTVLPNEAATSTPKDAITVVAEDEPKHEKLPILSFDDKKLYDVNIYDEKTHEDDNAMEEKK